MKIEIKIIEAIYALRALQEVQAGQIKMNGALSYKLAKLGKVLADVTAPFEEVKKGLKLEQYKDEKLPEDVLKTLDEAALQEEEVDAPEIKGEEFKDVDLDINFFVKLEKFVQ